MLFSRFLTNGNLTQFRFIAILPRYSFLQTFWYRLCLVTLFLLSTQRNKPRLEYHINERLTWLPACNFAPSSTNQKYGSFIWRYERMNTIAPISAIHNFCPQCNYFAESHALKTRSDLMVNFSVLHLGKWKLVTAAPLSVWNHLGYLYLPY